MIGRLKTQGFTTPKIAELLGRHRSTIWRELKRNATKHDGYYRAEKAVYYTSGRRRRSRRNRRFDQNAFGMVVDYLREKWSPEQISACLKQSGDLLISHETIYRYVWRDRKEGGMLWKCLRRGSPKQKRKRYNAYDSRGRLSGKRSLAQRPNWIDKRKSFGHWEIDTVMGNDDQHCVLTLVERKTGYALVGKLTSRKKDATAKRTIQLIKESGLSFKTITSDNGTEFHAYKDVEEATGTKYYFAQPYHSWERGTNENFNGLLRQYLPKRKSMKRVTQKECEEIAHSLNSRPRKRHNWRTPIEMLPS